MEDIKIVESLLAADSTLEVGLQNCPSEECDPVTLQVVLLGSDGIVIASDTCATNFNSRVTNRINIRTTEDVQKIAIVNSKFVYMFAGDECAKNVGAAVAQAVSENPECLSAALIDEISSRTLAAYRSVLRDRVDCREVMWLQVKNGGFIIWSAVCDDRDGQFVVKSSQVVLGDKRKVFAGDKSNPALYIVEHYYDNDKYPLRNISSLKIMAAHAVLTGGTFSANVRGLEMVVGNNSKGFVPVAREEIQKLSQWSRIIHEKNDSYFRDQNFLP